MVPTITDIRTERVKRRRVRTIYLDSECGLTITEETYLRFGLSVGQALDAVQLHDIGLTDGIARAREQALRLLNYRMRTRKELEQRLRQKEWSDEIIAQVIKRLEESDLIDDKQFARLWVDERLRLKPVGLNLLHRELRSKGIDPDTAESVLKEYDDRDDEATRAYALLHHRYNQYAELPPTVARRRMTGFLARRGFDHGIIYHVVHRVFDDFKEPNV